MRITRSTFRPSAQSRKSLGVDPRCTVQYVLYRGGRLTAFPEHSPSQSTIVQMLVPILTGQFTAKGCSVRVAKWPDLFRETTVRSIGRGCCCTTLPDLDLIRRLIKRSLPVDTVPARQKALPVDRSQAAILAKTSRKPHDPGPLSRLLPR